VLSTSTSRPSNLGLLKFPFDFFGSASSERHLCTSASLRTAVVGFAA